MGLLAVSVLVAAARWLAVGPSMFPLVVVHLGLLVGFAILSLLLVRFEGARAANGIRSR